MNIKPEIDWGWTKAELVKKENLKGVSLEALAECIEKAKPLAAPKWVSSERKILGLEPGSIKIEGEIRLSGKYLSSCLKDASAVRLFLVTIGCSIEDEASRLMKETDHLKGYLMDRIGSFAVESLAENFESSSRRLYEAERKSVSMRLSPGYCDWPIEEQEMMAKILDFSDAGVGLTESCMMVPRKSISAMVGIGCEGAFSKRESQCDVCNMKGCDYRRVIRQ